MILLSLDGLSWKPPPLSEAKVVGDFTKRQRYKPAIENQAMHKDNKELVQNEEFIKKQLKDAEFLAKVSAMYTICSKLCNVQFFEEVNLVSKDQIREITSNAIQEETALKLMGDDTDVCKTINKNN